MLKASIPHHHHHHEARRPPPTASIASASLLHPPLHLSFNRRLFLRYAPRPSLVASWLPSDSSSRQCKTEHTLSCLARSIITTPPAPVIVLLRYDQLAVSPSHLDRDDKSNQAVAASTVARSTDRFACSKDKDPDGPRGRWGIFDDISTTKGDIKKGDTIVSKVSAETDCYLKEIQVSVATGPSILSGFSLHPCI